MLRYLGILAALFLATGSLAGGLVSGPNGPAAGREEPATGREEPAESGRPNILFVIMDDWSWPYAGAYGAEAVNTPAFDRVAEMGILFTNAYCVSPSCTPSRGSVLTGQTIHRLEEGANLWSFLPSRFKVYPDILEEAGYQTGFTGKGWGPGTLDNSGRGRNPAGPEYNRIRLTRPDASVSAIDYAANFREFLKNKPEGKPFCFWYGSFEPHRPYRKGAGLRAGKDPKKVRVPAYLPDVPEVRSDLLDYFTEIEWSDRQLGLMLEQLEAAGELDNTLIVITGDNGLPFPRAKANLYDSGTRLPLAVCWPARIRAGQLNTSFVSFADFAPTFLEAAGLKPPPEMTGISFLDLLLGGTGSHRAEVFTERERHANVREGLLGYPARAVRTADFLYIRNIEPDRWPAGDPEKFGDVDASPSKEFILENRGKASIQKYFALAFARRPGEELYDLKKDSAQLVNVASVPAYAEVKKELRSKLERWMNETADPRAGGREALFDAYPYYGGKARREAPGRKPSGGEPAGRGTHEHSRKLAPAPPMGWNSWNWFGKRNINEKVVREVIDAMVREGLRDAGYKYVVIDGGWRDTTLGPAGELRANPERFPHGIKPLADYAHSKGLKIGLHTVPGTHDCGGDPVGGYGHEEVQIRQFADWGIDFIKLDKCKYADGWNEELLKETYFKWRDLLQKSGRDILLSISAYRFRDWNPQVSQMSRTTPDIGAKANGGARFDDEKEVRNFLSVMAVAEQNNGPARYAGGGYWNDPDMLVTGEQGLSIAEQQAHFALWCIMSSPLMLGNDPRNMREEEKAVILNETAIRVNQDPSGQGIRIKDNGDSEIWAKKLGNGNVAVLLLNRSPSESRNIRLDLGDLGFSSEVTVTDIYEKKKIGSFSGSFSQEIKPGTGLFVLLGT